MAFPQMRYLLAVEFNTIGVALMKLNGLVGKMCLPDISNHLLDVCNLLDLCTHIHAFR